MRTLAFLLLLLISILWESGAVYGRGSLSTWPHANNPDRAAQAEACTLDVVLVTFLDETTTTAGEDCVYCNHDRPYGDNPGESSAAADSSYKRRDFERLFSGGYGSLRDSAFVGTNQTVGKGHKLPEVFGSVRAYYDSMSLDPKKRAEGVTKGKFQLHVRLVNPDAGNGYPRWIELPLTKAEYAGKERDSEDRQTFWNDAYNAAWNAVQCWNPDLDDPENVTCGTSNLSGYDIKDLPNSDSADFSWQRLVRRKVVYLYSGATFTNENTTTLLHPQADMTTLASPRRKAEVGYRYVMGEREGWGNTNHAIDEFAGIGLHVHEIGHLLGLNHGEGEWTPDNSDGSSTQSETTKGANFVGWGLMQGGREGPELKDKTRGLSRAYSSCPVPINPFYRMDLGWLDPTEITESKTDYALALGSVHMIDVGTRYGIGTGTTNRDTLLLERRSNNSFGRYISFYEYKNQDPGLFIWRRGKADLGRRERPILIVADGQRIRDAQKRNPTVKEYQDQLSDPFPGSAGVNAVYATTGGEGLRQQTIGTYDHLDPGNLGVALTDIRRGNNNDALTLDVQLNYWAGDIAQQFTGTSPTREVWGDGVPSWDTGTVYVAGDLTIRGNTNEHKARLTIARGTEVRFLSDPEVTPYSDDHDDARSELIVEGVLTVEAESGVSDGGVTFRSATAVNPSNGDWYGIRVASGGTATLSDTTVRDGFRCVQDEGGTLTMTNATLSNCGSTVMLPSTPPSVGHEITATLTPAGNLTATDVQWQWQRRRSTDAWTNITSFSQENSSYTPTVRDIGSQLRATVRYQAEANVYPYAQSAATVSVQAGKPAAPVVSAQRRDGAIDLHIVLGADNGSPIKQVERRISHINGEEMVSVQWRRDPIDPNNKYRPYPSLFTLGFISPWNKLTNGKAYTFEVRAVNEKGASAVTSVTATPAGRPGAPPHVMPSPGDGQVVLRWDAADANGAAIERYEVQWRTAKSKRGGSKWLPVLGGHTARVRTITGLANGVLYEFSVRAVNGVGAGASASQSARPQAGLVRLPLTASRGDRQVALSWTAPSKRVSVHEYQVQHRISDSGQDWSSWADVSGGSTVRDSTITGLTNGVAYQFAVQAVDSRQTAVAVSDVVSATPAGRPGTPALTAVGGDGQVRLGWTAADANGSLITRYEVQWRVANSGHGWPDWSAVPGGRTARDSTVVGLLNGTKYEFAVRAVNGVGAGGSASQVATPQGSSRQVSFGSVSYQATEGGAAVSVSVGLSPAASQTVSIPVVVSADKGTEPGDYTVAGLTNGTVWLTFDSGESSQAFTITANDDDDIDDETVSLSFGKLPAGVVAKGTTRQATVTLLDDDEDTSPVFVPSSGTEDALVGSYFSFTRPSASGGNGSLSYSVSGTCPGLSVTVSSVSGQPSTAGQCGISWTATDTDGDKATYSLQISVAADTAPVFSPSSASRSAIVGQYFSFTRPSASGGNGSLSYSVSGTCPGLSVTTSSVSGQPSSSGQCGITWTVRDSDGDTDTYSLQISVAADTSPAFASSGTSRSAIVGQYFSFTRPSASGGNGSLSYSVSGTCPGLSVTTSSVSGQPSSSGQYGITWTVTDADGDTDTYSLQISVAADTSPSFASSGTSRSAIVGSYFSFTRPSASGGNGPLSYSVSGTCPGLSVTTSSVSGQPSTAGQCGITWTVRDSDGDTDTYSLQISVAADTSPSFASSGTSRSAIVGQYFSFTRPSASGGNGSLSYSVSGTCPGLTVTSSSVSGAPSSSGQYGITWTVTDADGDTDTYSLQISVASRGV